MAKRNEKGSLFLLAALAAVVVLLASQVKPAAAGTVSVYTTNMQASVRKVVGKTEYKIDLPGVIRLLFHDAFVRGQDASVLLTSTPFDTTDFASKTGLTGPTEQGSPSNGFLRGLYMIEEIRNVLFRDLGLRISCADAIAFAAREASYVLSKGNITYFINGPGRDDGVVSKADEPGNNLPGATFTFDQLLKNFEAKKGFGFFDLVALSAAHGIGVSHSKSYTDRLLPDVVARNEIDSMYQLAISKTVAAGKVSNNIRDMLFNKETNVKPDYKPNKVNMSAVGVLDNSFYNANTQNMVVLQSDWVLRTNNTAELLMAKYSDEPNTWKTAFEAAMTKLSNDLKAEGPPFEIGYRKKCTATNFPNKEAYIKA